MHTKPPFPLFQRGKLIADGLIAAWPMHDGYGTQLSDVAIHSNHGTLVNGPTWSSGNAGFSLDCDSAAVQHVAVPHDDTLNFGSGDFSVCAWVKQLPIVALTDSLIFGKRRSGAGAGQAGWQFIVNGQTGFLRMIIDNGISAAGFNATTRVDDDQWHHVAMVADRDANVTHYIDAVDDGGASIAAYAGSVDNTRTLYIGGNDQDGTVNNTFNGLMHDARFYNRIVSQVEIAQIAAGLG